MEISIELRWNIGNLAVKWIGLQDLDVKWVKLGNFDAMVMELGNHDVMYMGLWNLNSTEIKLDANYGGWIVGCYLEGFLGSSFLLVNRKR